MNTKNIIILLTTGVMLSGCNISSIGNSFTGQHYMRTGDYHQGEKTFLKEVAENPDDASGHYYLGRFLLAQHKYEPALAQLIKAVTLDSQDADYHFWLGVTYGHLGDIENERISYLNTLI